MADTYGLTLTDVLRHHERQAAHAGDRARHPNAKYETRMAWESDRDLHLLLAAVLREHIGPPPTGRAPTTCKFAAGGAPCLSHCGDDACLR